MILAMESHQVQQDVVHTSGCWSRLMKDAAFSQVGTQRVCLQMAICNWGTIIWGLNTFGGQEERLCTVYAVEESTAGQKDLERLDIENEIKGILGQWKKVSCCSPHKARAELLVFFYVSRPLQRKDLGLYLTFFPLPYQVQPTMNTIKYNFKIVSYWFLFVQQTTTCAFEENNWEIQMEKIPSICGKNTSLNMG